jgi:hypothetical protein
MRSWVGAVSSFGVVVMIEHVSTSSSAAGARQHFARKSCDSDTMSLAPSNA